MSANIGKRFEDDFRKSVPSYALLYRIPDSAQSFGGSSNLRFSRKNPFDYLMWDSKKHILYALELKTVAGKSISFERCREENKEIFGEYSDVINRHSYKSIKSQFKEGASKVNKEAIKSGFISKEDSQLGGSFFKMNKRKVNSLINVVKDDMKDVRTATLRFMNDTYRSTIYKAQIFAGTGAGTLQQAIDMATHDFLKKGINCIEYKDGRRINIADYCDMAVKTAQTRATLMGEGALRKRLGISTVYVTKHGTSCEKCSKWQGRVYIDDVWSGGTESLNKDSSKNYPLLSKAIEGGLFH